MFYLLSILIVLINIFDSPSLNRSPLNSDMATNRDLIQEVKYSKIVSLKEFLDLSAKIVSLYRMAWNHIDDEIKENNKGEFETTEEFELRKENIRQKYYDKDGISEIISYNYIIKDYNNLDAGKYNADEESFNRFSISERIYPKYTYNEPVLNFPSQSITSSGRKIEMAIGTTTRMGGDVEFEFWIEFLDVVVQRELAKMIRNNPRQLTATLNFSFIESIEKGSRIVSMKLNDVVFKFNNQIF